MKSIILFFQFLLFVAVVQAQSTDDHGVLEDLLDEFLAGASVNDVNIHERFWADDLIYTSSAGERITKTDIITGLSVSGPAASDGPVYHAEDVDIRLYGTIAVVAFRLVAVFPEAAMGERLEFFNTGTFLKKDGEWRAVAWQATRIPGTGR